MARYAKKVSDEVIGGLCYRKERNTLQYRTIEMSGGEVRLEIVSRFYSDYYGVCVIGRNKECLINRLADKLQRDFGFIGALVETDKDDSDKVGKRNAARLSVERPQTHRIGRRRELMAETSDKY